MLIKERLIEKKDKDVKGGKIIYITKPGIPKPADVKLRHCIYARLP